jgi:phosphatidylinositol 3-kinase
LSSQLAITVWDVSPTGGEFSRGHAIPFGGTTISLFDKDDILQKGRQKCHLHRHRPADGFSSTSTPAVLPAPRARAKHAEKNFEVADDQEEELERLEVLFKKHELGDIPRVDWLDQLVFESVRKKRHEVEKMHRLTRLKKRTVDTAKESEEHILGNGKGTKPAAVSPDDEPTESEANVDEKFTLIVDFPRFDFPIVFTDHEYSPPPISTLPNQQSVPSSVNLKPPPEVQYGPGIEPGHVDDSGNAPPLIRIYDPEIGQRENPAENKHRRLNRSHRTGVLDRDLKPNAKVRDELNIIMAYGPTQELNGDEKDLIWKFRHHLTRDRRALTKFIKSVNWQDQSEARQAVQILPKWTAIDVDDALELLGPTFDNPAVRAYAVDRLRKADDEELLLYLLQLVQALKFEKIPVDKDGNTIQDSSLAGFLISRATKNFMLGNFLHWYLMVECDDQSVNQPREHRKLFAKVEYDFMTELTQTPGGPERRKQLLRQGELITVLSKISKDFRTGRENRLRMIDRLKKFTADPKNEMVSIDPPLPLPLDPSISIVGCYPEESTVFKSSLFPLFIQFKTSDGKKYPIMFKTGDDLRQDQLVIQIISLMDRLLRKENLDLKLTPYHILATSSTAGAVQFIPSTTLGAAQTKYSGNYILAYLQANNPDKKAPLGVRKEAMDTYIKSCAGYCVVTYLLGVGDRHLDNLLLAPDGTFHPLPVKLPPCLSH